MTLPGGATCVSCVFWNLQPQMRGNEDRGRLGQCRRLPPRVLTAPQLCTRWPLVGEGDWCGEHAVQPPEIAT